MKKATVVVLCILFVALGVFGLVKAVPFVRDAIELERHLRQAAPREAVAEQEWRREFGDPDQILSAFPRCEDNESARRLIELAHVVGIDMIRRDTTSPVIEPQAERALNQAVADYVRAELTRPGGSVSAPPESARVHLERHSHDIDAIVDFLLSTAPPVWKIDVLGEPYAPSPNLSGQIRLQRLLVAQALNRARLGDEAAAERALSASWTLNASLRDRPDVLSQLLAIAVARMQVGLARRIPVDSAAWLNHFADHDYRSSLLKAMEAQSISGLRRLPAGSSLMERASRVDYQDFSRTFLSTLRDSPIAEGPIGHLSQLFADDNPRSVGGILAPIEFTNLANVFRRADRLIIDTELTERILEARMLKTRLGRWPTETPALKASRMPGGNWRYSVGADGRLTVSFSRELHWEGQNGLVLPLRYETS